MILSEIDLATIDDLSKQQITSKLNTPAVELVQINSDERKWKSRLMLYQHKDYLAAQCQKALALTFIHETYESSTAQNELLRNLKGNQSLIIPNVDCSHESLNTIFFLFSRNDE